MEFEQLAKKVQWLDDERRKDKNYIAHLDGSGYYPWRGNLQYLEKRI